VNPDHYGQLRAWCGARGRQTFRNRQSSDEPAPEAHLGLGRTEPTLHAVRPEFRDLSRASPRRRRLGRSPPQVATGGARRDPLEDATPSSTTPAVRRSPPARPGAPAKAPASARTRRCRLPSPPASTRKASSLSNPCWLYRYVLRACLTLFLEPLQLWSIACGLRSLRLRVDVRRAFDDVLRRISSPARQFQHCLGKPSALHADLHAASSISRRSTSVNATEAHRGSLRAARAFACLGWAPSRASAPAPRRVPPARGPLLRSAVRFSRSTIAMLAARCVGSEPRRDAPKVGARGRGRVDLARQEARPSGLNGTNPMPSSSQAASTPFSRRASPQRRTRSAGPLRGGRHERDGRVGALASDSPKNLTLPAESVPHGAGDVLDGTFGSTRCWYSDRRSPPSAASASRRRPGECVAAGCRRRSVFPSGLIPEAELVAITTRSRKGASASPQPSLVNGP